MKIEILDSIEECLRANIHDKSAVFVFTTDVVAQSWADWCVLGNIEGVNSVALNRFVAWDNFKGSFAAADMNDACTIPAILRKMFVHDLIRQNATADVPFFKKIISPELRNEAASFADWIGKNLPSLFLWKKRLDENAEEYGELDDEDKDYLVLYEKYSEFLKKNNLFEPSWVENVKFDGQDKKFFIFYPEQIEDFSDFKETFRDSDNVVALTLSKNVPQPKCYEYENARQELRHTILRMIDVAKRDGVDFSEIALSVPDIETYRPYIEREFAIYGIPYVIRAGVSLTKNCAGQFFREVSNCHNDNFSFDSVRALLLDENLPWKSEIVLSFKDNGNETNETFDFKKLREDFVREGNRMRCLCTVEEGKDIWETAFGKTYYKNKHLLSFYRLLKWSVEKFYGLRANGKRICEGVPFNFSEIKDAWFSFRESFLDDDFTNEANLILSRCIEELEAIISIEKDFAQPMGLYVDSPFEFFLKELDSKKYLAQTEKTGISVYPYKLSGCAYFKYQFVIDASQKNLDIPYKRLTFLNSNKRRKLGLFEDDSELNPSEVFAKLYAKKVEGVDDDFIHFSFSEETFSGFAIPHSSLVIVKTKRNDKDSEIPEAVKEYERLDGQDYVKNCGRVSGSGNESILKLTEMQKTQFKNWMESSVMAGEVRQYTTTAAFDEKIEYMLKEKRGNGDKIKISARGDLEKFFPCPRKWLFSKVLKFQEDSLDTELMKSNEIGDLNHKVLECVIAAFVGKKLPYFDEEKGIFMDENGNEVLSFREISDVVSDVLENGNLAFCESPLVMEMLLRQKNQIASTACEFLKVFLLPYTDSYTGECKNLYGVGKCEVHSVEKTFMANGEKFGFYGKIDCALKSPDNKWILIDYKNTKTAIPKKKDLYADEDGMLADWQMPLYFRLVSAVDKAEIWAGYFYAIKDKVQNMVVDSGYSKTDSKGVTETFNMDDFKPTMDALDSYCGIFTECVENGKFVPLTSRDNSFKQNVKDYEDCANCNYKAICRTTYSVAGKDLKRAEEEND